MASFDFDLEEMVTYGGREVPLRQALDEYIQAKKQAGASALLGPICFRQYGRRPGSLSSAQMEQIIASMPPEDLSRDDKY